MMRKTCYYRLVLFFVLATCISSTATASVIGDLWDKMTTFFTGAKKDSAERTFEIQPKSVINIYNLVGDVTVNTVQSEEKNPSQPKLHIAWTKAGSDEQRKQTKVIVTQKNNTYTVKTSAAAQTTPATVNVTITIPIAAAFNIEQEKGHIVVNTALGDINAKTEDGSITVQNAHGAVIGRAPKGKIAVDLAVLPPNTSVFLDAYDKITLGLSPKTRATLNAHTAKGTVSSELLVTLNPVTTKIDGPSKKRFWSNVQGTLGAAAGPAEYITSTIVLESINGSIALQEF